jgi:ABC-2 type transport system permease protein
MTHQLRKRWRSLLIWGAGLGALGVLYVALYPSMSGLMDEMVANAPESLKKWMGNVDGPMTAEQWMGMEFFSLLIPLALPFVVMVIGARTVAGDEERKNLDLKLSNPFPRWHLVVSAAGTMAVSLAAILAVTWALTYIAVPIAGVDLQGDRLALAFVALWPMCLLFGTFSLFLSTVVRRAFLATAIPAVILVAMYVIELLGQMTTVMEPVRVLSLFYHLGSPIEGDLHWVAAVLMFVGSCAFTGAAVAAFSKRDVYT